MSPLYPLHPLIIIGPFAKGVWTSICGNPLSGNLKYIVVVINYFTNLKEVMPRYNTVETSTWVFFNHVITQFVVPKELVYDHENDFENKIL